MIARCVLLMGGLVALLHCGGDGNDPSTFATGTPSCMLTGVNAVDAAPSGSCELASAATCIQVKAIPCSDDHPEYTTASAQECACVGSAWSCTVVAGGASQLGCATDGGV